MGIACIASADSQMHATWARARDNLKMPRLYTSSQFWVFGRKMLSRSPFRVAKTVVPFGRRWTAEASPMSTAARPAPIEQPDIKYTGVREARGRNLTSEGR